MRSKVKETIARYGMLKNGIAVVVGVSGGADSVALLHVLHTVSDEMRLKVIAAHLHHGLRGQEADRDENYVKALCTLLSVPCVTEHVNCAAEARAAGEGVEECGRRLRYKFFERVAADYENARIATAHSADDNLETLLLNVTRGASLKGLCGIPPVRGNIIRPLIFCSRAEIESYCLENSLAFMTDSTNQSCDYARNQIRHMVVPALKALNPNVTEAAKRLTELNVQDEAFLEELTDSLYTAALRGKNTFDAAALKNAALPLRSRLYIKIYESMTGERFHDYRTVKRVEAILYDGGKTQLQKNLFVELTGDTLRFFGTPAKSPQPKPTPVDQLPFYYDNGFFAVRITQKEESAKIHRLFTIDDIDCDTICGELVLRGRAGGDSFTLVKRGVTKSLKKLFSEEHIDSDIRSLLPVLADDEGVVWVQGFGANKRNAVNEKSETVIRVEGERLYD